MITDKQLYQLRADMANLGTGSKKRLARYLCIQPSNISRYLKYGDIPLEKYSLIKKFLKLDKK
jgi:hypothetical protein